MTQGNDQRAKGLSSATCRRVADERGQGLVEYALIIALVSLAAIAALGLLSGEINDLFRKTGNVLNNVEAGASGSGGGGGIARPTSPGRPFPARRTLAGSSSSRRSQRARGTARRHRGSATSGCSTSSRVPCRTATSRAPTTATGSRRRGVPTARPSCSRPTPPARTGSGSGSPRPTAPAPRRTTSAGPSRGESWDTGHTSARIRPIRDRASTASRPRYRQMTVPSTSCHRERQPPLCGDFVRRAHEVNVGSTGRGVTCSMR